MTSNNFLFYGLRVFAELIRDVLYFPAWWYSRGLLNLAGGLKNFLVDKQKFLALFVWIKNIFRPMYAQYDLPGMLISFFMRLFQIFARTAIMLIWIFVCAAIILFWILLPPFVVYEIIFQFL